ncbi:RNase adapter RapZ [Amycolatopsis sp. PS_44_ISF1]|uniref:RapZ C-terminal domain-containing protein n=1 Tax=Amycolatopsis sp. PS_44_ISF1 TaxID=2974917 RepID=UPI0028DD4225|nr:RNase adapter RapZ [Amycolatopsis sp. PS_44_ISF1]MDT8916249.1 ATPase [Amycolatopsis sp. PS_44_ISF1]
MTTDTTTSYHLELPGELIRFRIESFGYLHTGGAAPEAADLVLDVRHALKDPHVAPELRQLTGRDAAVRANVLRQPGAGDLVAGVVATALALRPSADARSMLVHVAIGCQGGRHRSVVLATEVAARLFAAGFGVHVQHSHLDRPVVAR